MFVQNCFVVFQAVSGVVFTTSQRCVPARTIRASAFASGAIASGAFGRAPCAASPEAVVTEKRSSYCGALRSGGSSSCGALCAVL